MKTELGWRPGRESGAARCTLEHVLDEDAALSDLLLNDELFVIGSDEKNHDDELKDGGCGIEWRMRRGEVVVGGERGSGSARYLKGQMRGLRNTRIRTCLRFGQLRQRLNLAV